MSGGGVRNGVTAVTTGLLLLGCRAYGPSSAPKVEIATEAGVAAFALGVQVSNDSDGTYWVRRQNQEEVDRLVWVLRESRLFRRVDYASNVYDENAAFVAVEPVQRACFSEPLLTILTLGIVPNVTCYRSGYILSFSRCDHEVRVDSTAEGTLVIGWVAPLIATFPGWTWRYPKKAEADALALAVQGAFEELEAACSRDN